MSPFQSMLESQFVQRLGWALLHSLWQGAAVSVALMVLLVLTRKASPQIRYLVSCGVMLVVMVLPIVTFCRMRPPAEPVQTGSIARPEALAQSPRALAKPLSAQPAPPTPVDAVIVLRPPAHDDAASPVSAPTARPLRSILFDPLQSAVPWLVLVWACGVAGLSLWNLGGWVAIQRLKATSNGKVDQEIRDLADRVRRRIGLRRAVRLLNSARVITPMVIGVFKPVILFPACALSGMSPAQIESILAHELAHVRRHDYLVNLIQSLIETLMFYHPAVWWIGRRIRIERENCCDDVALSLTRDRVTYASALALVACSAPGLAPAASGGVLLARVRRILGLPGSDIVGAPRWLSGALVLAVALAVGALLHPQSPAASAAAKPPQTQPATLSLTILDQDSDRPLEGVHISTSSHEKIPKATTDAEGHATLELPRKDLSMNVWARKDGYVPTVAMWGNAKGKDPIPPSFTMKLERGQTIGGKVVDEGGAPIAGATVYLNVPRFDHSWRRVSIQIYDDKFTTDAKGQWQCSIIPRDATQIALRLEHPDYASDSMYGQSAKPSMDELLKSSDVVVMKKGFTVAGRILEEDGSPIEGARVIFGPNSFGQRAPETHTNKSGEFTLQHCPPEEHAILTAIAKGHAPRTEEFRLAGEVVFAGFHLKRAKSLIVRVVNAKGEPLAGARLFLQRWHSGNMNGTPLAWDQRTDAQGRVIWNEPPDDTFYVSVSHPDCIQVSAAFNADGHEQTITLLPELKVSGSVIDDKTGKPVDRAHVISGWTSGTRPPFWDRDRSLSPIVVKDGRFQYTEDLERDGYAVRVEADGYLPAESKIFHKEDGHVELTFRLKKGSDIRETLVTPQGKPLAGADVLLVNESSQIFIDDGVPTRQTFTLRTKTDPKGHFRLPPQAGEYRLMVLHPQGFAELSPNGLGGGAPIVVRPWATVEEMAREGSKPASRRTVIATHVSEAREERGRINLASKAIIADDGHFRIGHVVPGTNEVAFYVELAASRTAATYSYTQRHELQANAGEVAHVDLGGSGRPVVGRVVVPPSITGQIDWITSRCQITSRLHLPARVLPANWKQMDANARAQWNQQWRQSPDVRRYNEELKNSKYYPVKLEANGTFRVDDVQAGTYDLRIQGYNGSSPPDLIGSASQEFTVDPMPGGRSDQPLDIGTIGMTTNKAP